MNRPNALATTGRMAVGCLLALSMAACNSFDTRPDDPRADCPVLEHQNLEIALEAARESLQAGCAGEFDAYLDSLLTIAQGDPGPENRERFSEFLVWSTEQGLLSRLQAKALYNRYFSIKFVSMAGDYNNCALSCPRKQSLLSELETELADKEIGLMKVSGDQQAYYRADRLFQELELVLEATCTACSAAR
ncbi:MAG: hypothetical protein QNJ82_13740 [Gammaproteobacteria bacterium]|nr:hypothetical protein [Gammaproteobacteria bacterium]